MKSRKVSKKEWYAAGGFANSLCWRKQKGKGNAWLYYIRYD